MSSTATCGFTSAEEEAREEEFLSQTAEEKREVRANLRKLQQRIQQTKENLYNGATDEEREKLKGVLEEAIDVTKKIKGTGEAIEDSKMFNALCQTVRKISEDTNLSEQNMDVEDYVEKLGRWANASRDDKNKIKITKNQLLGLGEKVSQAFKRAPVLTFIHGAIDTDGGEQKARRQRGRERVQERPRAPTKTTIVEERQTVECQRTAKLVDSTMKILEGEYRNNMNEPVNYFKFVIDPESFGRTVENMFHVSFLVKQRRVELSVCPEIQLPMLRPTSTESDGGEEDESGGKNQAIISLSWTDWEELKEALDVTTAVIDHGEDSGEIKK